MPRLSHILPRIRQRGTYWCIPAGIENMLRCVDYNDLTQEDLVIGVVRPLGNTNESDPEILERFRCERLPNATFQTFRVVAEHLMKTSLSNWKFELKDKVNERLEYVRYIKEAIAADEPILISVKNPTGEDWHITMVYEYNGDVLSWYDLAQDTNVNRDASRCSFSADILVLRKT